MIVDLSSDIFSCDTRVFVYVLVHVMCLCVYVSMVCQRCMLYDDMYLHDIVRIEVCKRVKRVSKFFEDPTCHITNGVHKIALLCHP
jgi:hypothetical protein